MALKAFLTTLDGLADTIKSEYVAVDGGFKLDVTEVNGLTLSDGKGLKSALETERTRARKLEERFAPVKDFEPSVLAEAAAKLAEIKSWTPDQKTAEIIRARETELQTRYSSETKKVSDRAEKLQQQLENILIDQTAAAAIAEAGGKVRLLLPAIRSQLRPREVDGRFVVDVVDSNGNARIGSDAGSNMTIKELVAEMKADAEFKMAFAASGQSGGGTTSSHGGRNSGPTVITAKDLAEGNFDPAKLATGEQQMG